MFVGLLALLRGVVGRLVLGVAGCDEGRLVFGVVCLLSLGGVGGRDEGRLVLVLPVV